MKTMKLSSIGLLLAVSLVARSGVAQAGAVNSLVSGTLYNGNSDFYASECAVNNLSGETKIVTFQIFRSYGDLCELTDLGVQFPVSECTPNAQFTAATCKVQPGAVTKVACEHEGFQYCQVTGANLAGVRGTFMERDDDLDRNTFGILELH